MRKRWAMMRAGRKVHRTDPVIALTNEQTGDYRVGATHLFAPFSLNPALSHGTTDGVAPNGASNFASEI